MSKRNSDLKQVVECELHARIAEHKAMVIASDFGLQRTLARDLGRLGGSGLEVTAAHLGVDFTAGRSFKSTKRKNTNTRSNTADASNF